MPAKRTLTEFHFPRPPMASPATTTTTIQRAPAPPPEPCPWVWRCHQCHILYRLATTRRCLECDHTFCLGVPSDSLTTTTSKKRKRRASGPCRAEFDYIGWAAHGAWKRTILLNNNNNNTRKTDDDQEKVLVLNSPRRRRSSWVTAAQLATAWGNEHRALEHGQHAATAAFEAQKDALFVRRRHDCWVHCDFPSECHHALYKAQQEGRTILELAEREDEVFVQRVLLQDNDDGEDDDDGSSASSSRRVVRARRDASLRPVEETENENAWGVLNSGIEDGQMMMDEAVESESDSDDDDMDSSDFSSADDTSDSASDQDEEVENSIISSYANPSSSSSSETNLEATETDPQSPCGFIDIALVDSDDDDGDDYSYDSFKQSYHHMASSPCDAGSSYTPIPSPPARLTIPDNTTHVLQSFPLLHDEKLSPLEQAHSDQAWVSTASSPRTEMAGQMLMLLGRRHSLSPVVEETSPEVRMASFGL